MTADELLNPGEDAPYRLETVGYGCGQLVPGRRATPRGLGRFWRLRLRTPGGRGSGGSSRKRSSLGYGERRFGGDATDSGVPRFSSPRARFHRGGR